jgi:tetratricopeptide (TPR) repeat protein
MRQVFKTGGNCRENMTSLITEHIQPRLLKPCEEIMKKTIIILTFLILLFSYTSVQAKMSMRITSGQTQADEKKADADSEKAKETREIEETIEVIETVETKEVTDVIEVKEVKEIEETIGAVGTKEVIEATETKAVKEIGPVDYKALGLRSVELNPNDYPDEVIALLEPHKDSDNNDSVLFYSSLGLAYKNKGRFKDAIAAYKRALELVPNVSAIQYNLGVAYFYNNELPESFKYFLKSSEQRPDHPGTKKWIKHLAGELNIYKVPDTGKLKLVLNKKMSVNRKKTDRESRLRIYLTEDGGRIQELSVKDKIYSYGIDSDTERPVDYIIIDNDGDGDFDKVINTKGEFGIPTWAYNPD